MLGYSEMCKNEKNAGIDECIKPIIDALNNGGINTIASCCGHGYRTGRISLKDGRELVIFSDYNSCQEYEKTQLFDINGNKIRKE